jgi:rSAM/selenodomain-associated transferase 1
MQAKAARRRLRIMEVPVRYRRRIGRSKISGTVSGTLRAGAAILATIVKVALEPARPSGTQRLLIFLKTPTSGTVKTRLARAVGPEAAGALYRACVELTLERLARFQREAVLCVDPPQALAQARDWLGPAWRYQPQQGADLGERLAEATAKAFAEGATRVVVIGTDAPWLDADDIASAFRALERAEVVLGPTDDGGYYLIGLSQPAQALFEGVSWSSSSVFEQTRATASALGLRVETLPPGYDLDHLSDVQRFLAEERRKGTVSNAVAIMEALSHRRESAWS